MEQGGLTITGVGFSWSKGPGREHDWRTMLAYVGRAGRPDFIRPDRPYFGYMYGLGWLFYLLKLKKYEAYDHETSMAKGLHFVFVCK